MAGEETGAPQGGAQNTGGAAPAAETLLTGADKPADKPADKQADKQAEGSDKPADKPADKPKDGDKPADKPADKPVVPETYEAPKLPEGVTLEEAGLQGFNALAKEVGLTQEGYQKLVDYYVKIEQSKIEGIQKSWEATGKTWADAAKADKEIGGAKFEENVALAKEVLKKFGTPELTQALVQYQMGNNPEVLRLLVRIGAAVKDDTFVPGGKGTNQATRPEDVLFPSMRNLT